MQYRINLPTTLPTPAPTTQGERLARMAQRMQRTDQWGPAQAVRDIPLAELFRRIDDIAVQYGPNTDVQISSNRVTHFP